MQVGDSAAQVLGSLGRAFEALDVKAAAAAAGQLEGAARALPPGSSQRARLGQRLTAFAGPLKSGDKQELKKVSPHFDNTEVALHVPSTLPALPLSSLLGCASRFVVTTSLRLPQRGSRRHRHVFYSSTSWQTS